MTAASEDEKGSSLPTTEAEAPTPTLAPIEGTSTSNKIPASENQPSASASTLASRATTPTTAKSEIVDCNVLHVNASVPVHVLDVATLADLSSNATVSANGGTNTDIDADTSMELSAAKTEPRSKLRVSFNDSVKPAIGSNIGGNESSTSVSAPGPAPTPSPGPGPGPASQTTKKVSKKGNQPMPFISAAQPSLPADADTNSSSDSNSNSTNSTEIDRIKLGICAMDKKARSKPMAEILSRLDAKLFHVIFFGDEVIKNRPIEEWPICNVVIAFYSKGYPLAKAKEYVALRKPFILNDLEMQELLKDRRRVYDLLEASGIDVPRHVYMSRDGYVSTGTGDGNVDRNINDPDSGNGEILLEFDDHIEINGVSMHKPFVEKPVDADDHNIAIYYPSSAGGGCKKLFRKIGNRSSEFYPDINEVRRDGSYLYEEFVETQGTDVKMYTVGPEYGHAEARKSPTVDGKVQRNSDGKEVRFPVILTLREKEIARRIVLGFKQFVCGFDLLRVQEGHSVVSYVCDVNGWSFVKNSRKYYDDCAQILTEHMCAAVKPNSLKGFSTLDPLVTTSNDLDDSIPLQSFFVRTSNRLASILHGGEYDRRTTGDRLHGGELLPPDDAANLTAAGAIASNAICPSPSRSEHSSTPSAATTLEDGAIPVRDMPDSLASEPASISRSIDAYSTDDLTRHHNFLRMSTGSSSNPPGQHQEELRCVIAVIRHGDRTPKQKLKVNMTEPLILEYFHKHASDPSKDLKIKDKAPMTEFLDTVKTILTRIDIVKRTSVGTPPSKKVTTTSKLVYQLRHMRDVLERWKITGLNRKLQIKPRKWADEAKTSATQVQLILKWGGNLTKLGEKQSINLGRRLRHDMYPDSPGGGILRLHSTFRHDLKIKTSDEGRVMKTAAAFAKGLLELEGEITPILVSLVHKEKGSMHMLDPSGDKEVKLELDECKEKITANLQRDIDYRETTEEERECMVGPPELTSMRDALATVGNPRKTLMEIHKTMGILIDQLEEMLDIMGSGDEMRIEGGEGLQGEEDEDVVLSGVKLYKGETLLELTERWRFIYKRLYDEDEDRFDLSRIPDVHDNVRFDVLHNPHLGLTSTLEKLYELAKNMADCVVPQEYGTTTVEKRSVGVKICRSLLEKIMNDLSIARTDNKADMRYMINMDYSADLPINTMGRRIRTRLYFTSESHLHTMLNVLRFAGQDGMRTLLSLHGMELINSTPELCYLTQIVIRLFEDTNRRMDDPRRFRVEILFSPGAIATPFHMNEADRENDSSRFDTAPLENIGKEGLTCKEVEDFFGFAILEGRNNDGGDADDRLDIMSASTAGFWKKIPGDSASTAAPLAPPRMVPSTSETQSIQDISMDAPGEPPTLSMDGDTTEDQDKDECESEKKDAKTTTENEPDQQEKESPAQTSKEVTSRVCNIGLDKDSCGDGDGCVDGDGCGDDDDGDDEEEAPKRSPRLISHEFFWGTIALGSLLLGAGCIIMALSLSDRSSVRRRWNRR